MIKKDFYIDINHYSPSSHIFLLGEVLIFFGLSFISISFFLGWSNLWGSLVRAKPWCLTKSNLFWFSIYSLRSSECDSEGALSLVGSLLSSNFTHDFFLLEASLSDFIISAIGVALTVRAGTLLYEFSSNSNLYGLYASLLVEI